jgi:DNA-binding winged helix-turn-helix (wHTH) protein
MTENPADPNLHNFTGVAIRKERIAATSMDHGVTRHCGQQLCLGDLESSDDLFRNVTSQLRAASRVRGCALPVAEDLAQQVTGEVKARVREVLRRPGRDPMWILGVIHVGNLTLDLERHIFWRGDDEVHLSPKEFDLLALLMKNADVLLPHVKLLRSVWGLEYVGELEYLRTIVYTLRRKIEKSPANPEDLMSEPGIGYRFRNPASPARRFPASAVLVSEFGGVE